MPPKIIRAIMVMLITGLPAKAVREEYFCVPPIRSKPALQKAEMEWNTANQMPLGKPKLLIKTGIITKAPMVSVPKVVRRINFVNFTIPLI